MFYVISFICINRHIFFRFYTNLRLWQNLSGWFLTPDLVGKVNFFKNLISLIIFNIFQEFKILLTFNLGQYLLGKKWKELLPKTPSSIFKYSQYSQSSSLLPHGVSAVCWPGPVSS